MPVNNQIKKPGSKNNIAQNIIKKGIKILFKIHFNAFRKSMNIYLKKELNIIGSSQTKSINNRFK